MVVGQLLSFFSWAFLKYFQRRSVSFWVSWKKFYLDITVEYPSYHSKTPTLSSHWLLIDPESGQSQGHQCFFQVSFEDLSPNLTIRIGGLHFHPPKSTRCVEISCIFLFPEIFFGWWVYTGGSWLICVPPTSRNDPCFDEYPAGNDHLSPTQALLSPWFSFFPNWEMWVPSVFLIRRGWLADNLQWSRAGGQSQWGLVVCVV